jgi:hypothetical protein
MEGIENIVKKGVRSTRCRKACMRDEMVKNVCNDRVRWYNILSAFPVRDMV